MAPPLPGDLPLWKGAALVMLATSLAFPMAGITLVLVLAIDMIVISNLPLVKKALS